MSLLTFEKRWLLCCCCCVLLDETRHDNRWHDVEWKQIKIYADWSLFIVPGCCAEVHGFNRYFHASLDSLLYVCAVPGLRLQSHRKIDESWILHANGINVYQNRARIVKSKMLNDIFWSCLITLSTMRLLRFHDTLNKYLNNDFEMSTILSCAMIFLTVSSFLVFTLFGTSLTLNSTCQLAENRVLKWKRSVWIMIWWSWVELNWDAHRPFVQV